MESAVKYNCKIACYDVTRADGDVWYIPELGLKLSQERMDAFTKMKAAVPTLNGGRWVTMPNGARVFIRPGFISVGVRKEPKASAKGYNRLTMKDFKTLAVAKDHIEKHVKSFREYRTAKAYIKRAIKLAQTPVGGDVIGYARKDGMSFVRYNKATNDYVIAKVGSRGGIVTMFKPKRGESYYLDNMKKDGIRQ